MSGFSHSRVNGSMVGLDINCQRGCVTGAANTCIAVPECYQNDGCGDFDRRRNAIQRSGLNIGH
jgi:hypothetical protein